MMKTPEAEIQVNIMESRFRQTHVTVDNFRLQQPYSSTKWNSSCMECVPPVTNVPTPLQMFPSRKNHTVLCAEVKVRWKESEVAFQRNFQSQGACLPWYHHELCASVPEDALENSNVQWYCHHSQ